MTGTLQKCGKMTTKFLDGLAEALAHVVAVLFMIMLIVVTTEIFSRYVLHESIRWSFELSRYILVWFSFLGTGVCIRTGELVAITFVKNALPPKTAKIVLFAGMLFTAGFLVFCIWYGIILLFTVARQTSPAMGISMWIPYLSVPVGSFFMLIFLVEGMFKV